MAGSAWGHPKGTALEACRKQGCGQGAPVQGEQSRGPGPHRTCADSLLSATLGSSLSSASALQRLASRSESGGRGGQPPLTHFLCPRAHQPPRVHALIHTFTHSCIGPVVHSSLSIHPHVQSVPYSFVTPHSRQSLLTHSCTFSLARTRSLLTRSCTPSPSRNCPQPAPRSLCSGCHGALCHEADVERRS